ncbi:MFS general substrate transporter [Backusella circina FSU 941]|nr:MFS general substrate transporter [Backusella circina FSU 941]
MFLPLFYKKVLGLGNDKIGFIYSITPFVSSLAFPYWTSIVDRNGNYKQIMMVNMAIALVCISSIAGVPYISETDTIRIVLVSLCCFGYAFFGYPVIAALVDAVVFRVLGDQRERLYGRQKMCVPVGFASSVFLTGFLIEKLDSVYALFIVFAVYNLGFIITCMFTDMEAQVSYQKLDDTHSEDYGAISSENDDIVQDDDGTITVPQAEDEQEQLSFWDLLKQPNAKAFYAFMLMMGFSLAVIQAFLYIYFENDLHGSAAMTGLFGPLGSSTEFICFFFSKEIFQHLGTRRMLLVGQGIIAYRSFIYYISATLSWGALLTTITQVLHGIGFSMTWSAAALQANALAPIGLKGSSQGLLNMCFNGVGSGVGALLGGLIYEQYGGRVMWVTVGCLSFVSVLIYARNSR